MDWAGLLMNAAGHGLGWPFAGWPWAGLTMGWGGHELVFAIGWAANGLVIRWDCYGLGWQ
jgi:hypothetical protein